MTKIIADHIIERLIEIESQVHYGEPAPPGKESFIARDQKSPVLISAPHGARTFRNNGKEVWHEEDEYTAGMALLLSEICQTSVIATIYRNDKYDPNHSTDDVGYKQRVKEFIEQGGVKFVIDLHGASNTSSRMAETQWVDLGMGNRDDYLPKENADYLRSRIEYFLGEKAADRGGKGGWKAASKNTIAGYTHQQLKVSSVQIEMKPIVRIPQRRVDASAYESQGSYAAPRENIIHMLQALVDFIEYLKGME